MRTPATCSEGTLEGAYVGQDIANLRFGLYNRCLEPGLFRIFKERTIERVTYRADFWIIGSSHVVNVTTEHASVAEVISGDDNALPSNGRIELIRSFKDQRCDFHVADELTYRAELELVNYAEDDLSFNEPTLHNEDILFRLQHRFPTREDLAETPVTVIDVLKADECGIEVKTFHSYVEVSAVVVTHSIIQVNSA